MSSTDRILVATEVQGDADLIRKLLRDEFDNVIASTDPARAVADFETHRPDVLVLAFNSLEKAERYYLGLYRLGTLVHALPHRTVILCNKEDLQRVYQLCKKEYFDDYVLFWPVPNDAPRLPMAIHHALRQRAAGASDAPTAGEFAAQARRLVDIESLLEQHAASALPPVREWVGAIKNDLAPQFDSARALRALTERVRPLVLIVDDDEYQHKLLRILLRDTPVELAFASSGAGALATLRKRCPELILMDVDLPDIDGVQTTRRIKSVDQFANVPILMITGHSDREIVVQSIKAGAAGFVVKPFNREILLAKVRSCLVGVPAVLP